MPSILMYAMFGENSNQRSIVFCYTAIIISAIMYAEAYWYPVFFWWSACASMMPLCVLLTELSSNYFWYGILWALISYSMHLWGVVTGIVSLAAYSTWYAWIPGILLIAYLTVYTGCMWAFGAWCEKRIRKKSAHFGLRYSFWGAWLGLYWHTITYVVFLPLGRCEGYLLLNPTIPLAMHPIALLPVFYLGVSGYAFTCCCIAALSMYVVMYGSHQKIMILCVGWIFVIGVSLYGDRFRSTCNDAWYTHVIGIAKTIGDTDQIDPACRLLCDYVLAATQCKGVVAVIFPESAVYPWALCAESRLADFMPLQESTVQDYIIGSFYDDDGVYRNSCYWLRHGILQKRFDKRHAMPLIERVPRLLRCSLVQRLFFTYMPEIVPSDNQRPYMIVGEIAVVPYICSELFFNKNADDLYPELPIIALVNDRWCDYKYMKNLMYLGAIVQAYAWHREILYVSYSRCNYITPVY